MAIDPIPCIGDPCADAGFFAAGQPPAAGIFPRAAAMATRRPDQAELEATVSSGAFGQLIHR